jgi:hypothetical protein
MPQGRVQLHGPENASLSGIFELLLSRFSLDLEGLSRALIENHGDSSLRERMFVNAGQSSIIPA